MSLKLKFILFTSGLVAAAVLSTALYLLLVEERDWERHLTEQGAAAAEFTTLDLLRAYGMNFRVLRPGSRDEFERVIQGIFLRMHDLERIMIVNRSGQVLYDSAKPGDPDPGDVGTDRIRRLEQAPSDVRKMLYGGRKCLDVLATVTDQTGPRFGMARYIISFRTLDERLASLRLHFLLPAIVFMLLGMGAALLVSVRLTRPILDLAQRARELESGNPAPREAITRQDELGHLSRSFEDMAKKLLEKKQDLEDRNETLSRANTELKQLQQELIHSESLAVVGRMAVSLSHEIDNPIGVIMGFAECLIEELPPGNPHRDDVENILNESRRIKAITRGLLDLSRPMEFSFTPVDLPKLLTSIRETLSVRPEFRDIVWEIATQQGIATIEADADALRRVFVNLCLNAAQAMEGRGTIRIELANDIGDGVRDGIVLCIADTGTGIAPEDMDRIFNPFYSTKAIGIGSGLGLSLSQRIIQSHGGTIRLESPGRAESPGRVENQKGAVFTLHLPLKQDPERNTFAEAIHGI